MRASSTDDCFNNENALYYLSDKSSGYCVQTSSDQISTIVLRSQKKTWPNEKQHEKFQFFQ